MDNNLNIIYKKLEEFISRYYFFKIIKGSLMLFSLFILFILVQSVIEYFNYLATSVKTFLFFLTCVSVIILLVYYFLIPLLELLKLRKPISYFRASAIISKHFPEIKDKLLNTLELGEILNSNSTFKELLLASINQRLLDLSPLPFKKAINFKQVKNNLVFFGLSIFILLMVFAFNSKVLKEGTIRLLNYSKYYEPKAPFRFEILNKNLICEKNKDFAINLSINGDYIPQNVYINISGNTFSMRNEKEFGKYSFIFRNVNNSFDFKFVADNYESRQFKLEVLPAPILKGFTMFVVPPSNTGIEPFQIVNTGDCTVPSGSTIKWEMKTMYVDFLQFIFAKDTLTFGAKDGIFNLVKQIREQTNYAVILNNKNFHRNDNLNYSISVIKDQFPEIDTKQIEDSLKIGAFYFMISIKDDYGFHDLNFVRKVLESDSSKVGIIEKVPINQNTQSQDLFFYYDFNKIDSLPNGNVVEYYFEVRDNDFINNFKAARSSAKVFKLLDRNEIRDQIENYDKNREEALSNSKRLTEEIKKDINDFKQKELSNELTEWEKKNFLKNISEKQKSLDKFVKDLFEQNKKSNQASDQFYEEQKNLEEKQKQIQELLNQIMDDELKKLLEEIEKLSDKFDPNQFENIKEKLDFSYKNMEKKLDRSIELLKRYKVEENVMQLSEDLKKLSEKENSVSNNLEELKKKNELIEKQNEIKKEYNDLKQEYKETIDKNNELKSPMDIEKFDKEFDDINQDLDELEKETPGGSKGKLRKMQEKAAQDMENLSKKLEQMFNEMEMNSIELNIADLRQIIDNVSTFSLNQEENFVNTNKQLQNSPKFPNLIERQVKISDDFKIIEDSIRSLMEKVPQMSEIMVKEIQSILFNLEKSNQLMELRNRREALKFQRYILNSSNTLALYLAELKDQMEKQQQGSGSGKSKKGKQEESMENLKQQQKQLKKELEKLLEQMRSNSGKPNDNAMNDQIVKTLAEQEIFNKMIQEMQNQKGINPETDKQLKEIKKLSDQNVEDLINKKITPELLNRNQKILTRLLESDRAEKEREQENKRESKEGEKKDMNVPEELKELLKNEKKYRETLQKSDLNLKNYYKNISNDYFRIINK
jgi:flagellar biosynthesis GTPase FlhF